MTTGMRNNHPRMSKASSRHISYSIRLVVDTKLLCAVSLGLGIGCFGRSSPHTRMERDRATEIKI